MIKITPLFSGSKGNSTLIQTDKVSILLDMGYCYKQITARLAESGLDAKDIDGIVITHEHSDHISALPLWTRSFDTQIYAPELIADYIRQRTYGNNVEEITGSFVIGDVKIDCYECSHDSRVCYGYRFSVGEDSVASVTDTGCFNDGLIGFLAPCSTVQLESNHDEDMLKHGSYHYLLKKRILSDSGHLSNAQTAEILARLASGKLKNVILAHLSEENNTKELAFNSAFEALKKSGRVEGRDVRIYIADQYTNRFTIC
ncbi:MAG: MBL fold metallo-hydrolase [Corallococcus sp.]|nr:MBL fold metallo-hydrolase [Bacillota bacterium]MCM1533223.1 MBL fold metallo-hydrolase [Corallococcus sp.]